MVKKIKYVIDFDIVASGSLNVEIENDNHILCGAGYNVSTGVFYYDLWSDLIVCLGNESCEYNIDKMYSDYRKILLNRHVSVHLFENYGKILCIQ